MPKKRKPSSKPFTPRGAELGPLPVPTEEELTAELIAGAGEAGRLWDELMPEHAGLLGAEVIHGMPDIVERPGEGPVMEVYNFRKGRYEQYEIGDTPWGPEYVDQNPASQGMYEALIFLGKTSMQAVLICSLAYAGLPNPDLDEIISGRSGYE